MKAENVQIGKTYIAKINGRAHGVSVLRPSPLGGWVVAYLKGYSTYVKSNGEIGYIPEYCEACISKASLLFDPDVQGKALI